jgi:hypothetical protein
MTAIQVPTTGKLILMTIDSFYPPALVSIVTAEHALPQKNTMS